MKLVILALVLGVMLFTVGPVYGFKSKITATVKVEPDTDRITVYVLCGIHCYKEKTVSVDAKKKVTIKINVAKGSQGKVCAYDADDDERFLCSKQITIDQKKENVKINLRNA
jgi:hypothetical protein